MNAVLFIVYLIFGLLFAALFAWIAIESGRKTFSVTENATGGEKHWTRFAGVVTGIIFMSAALSSLLSPFSTFGGGSKNKSY